MAMDTNDDADADAHLNHRAHLVKEGLTMALYVAVCLVAVLTTLTEHPEDDHTRSLAIIWGTTIGLAVAHLFAFRVSARLIGRGSLHPDDVDTAWAQLAGSAAVAALASLPVLLLPADVELRVTRYVLVAAIGAVAYAVASRAGAGRGRALGYALATLAVGGLVVTLKNALAGH